MCFLYIIPYIKANNNRLSYSWLNSNARVGWRRVSRAMNCTNYVERLLRDGHRIRNRSLSGAIVALNKTEVNMEANTVKATVATCNHSLQLPLLCSKDQLYKGLQLLFGFRKLCTLAWLQNESSVSQMSSFHIMGMLHKCDKGKILCQ
jgi:hypothetical protein